MKYIIRKSSLNELPVILRLRDQAREIMRSYGNTFQWPDGYPRDGMFKNDIEQGYSYIMEDENRSIVGTFALIPGPDITYNVIYDGQWLNDEPYYVIHRIASTHEANIIMRKGLEKHGYQYCGIIHILDGSERLAFQKNVSLPLI